MRDHLEADERQIENQIGATFKEAPFQKGSVMQPIKVNYLYHMCYCQRSNMNQDYLL